MTNPFLIGFCNLIADVTRPDNPNPPVEIHHLLHGIPGFSVAIEGWGSRERGYFKFLLDADARNNNNHFEENTYLVFVVEKHVVNGEARSLIPGQQALGFHQFRGM